jgi:biotin transporter BioY
MLLVWIAAAALCGWLASRKGRNVGAWVVIGLLTGVIGVVVIAALPAQA